MKGKLYIIPDDIIDDESKETLENHPMVSVDYLVGRLNMTQGNLICKDARELLKNSLLKKNPFIELIEVMSLHKYPHAGAFDDYIPTLSIGGKIYSGIEGIKRYVEENRVKELDISKVLHIELNLVK